MTRFTIRWCGVSTSTPSPLGDPAVPLADPAVGVGSGAGESVPVVRLLGIRHHGPGSARAVERSLQGAPPDIVLIEGPADADPVLALALHEQMRPPVALLSYALDRPEVATFHPLASFSPEWVALTWALRHEVPVRFIDLASKHALAGSGTGEQLSLSGECDTDRAGPSRPADPLAELALAAGYDDAERWWEDMVEHRGDASCEAPDTDTEAPDAALPDLAVDEPFVAIGEAMHALRAMYEPTGEPIDAAEQRREAHMRAAIRTAVRDGYRHVVVVCGAWHVPALRVAFETGRARRDTATLRGLAKVKAAVTWVPWTHRRLASGTGYSAGVTAPGWYHHLYTHAGADVIARWFSEAAQVLRAGDHPVSAADAVEATRLAEALAAIRNRPLAGLAEVDDAARAVLGQGTDAPMRMISDSLVIGHQIGAVPDATPMVPLARSLAAEQRRCRLKPDGARRTLELDLRRPLDLHRSELLHRLGLLGVVWGVETEGRSSAGTFRETWSLRWEPELEVRIIESAALGTTVVAASTEAVLQRARSATSLGDLTVLLEAALLARLDDAVPAVLAAVSQQSAMALDVQRLLDALPPLVRTRRYGDIRSGSSTGTSTGTGDTAALLDGVIEGLVSRVAAGLVAACAGLADEASASMADSVREAQAALGLLGRDHLLTTFVTALAGVSEHPRVHGLVQGLATRLLTDALALSAAASQQRVSRALSIGTPPTEAAFFVEGFLGGSGTVLVHDPLLLGVLDGWLATLTGDAFTDVVPLLRRTFGAFEAAERRAIGERVRTGETPSAAVSVELDPERVAAALVTVGQLLGVSP